MEDEGFEISVVIPAFNVERWLPSAIDSALEQSLRPVEVIVVDDGSTDHTPEVARRYGKRVKLLKQPTNGGLAAARNAGAGAAKGEWLFFLDADDSLLPGAFDHLGKAIRSLGECGAFVPNYLEVGPSGESHPAWGRARGVKVLGRSSLASVILRNPLSPNSLVRRSVWERFRFPEELRACEDLAFWFSLLLENIPIAMLSPPLVAKRVGRPGALSTKLLFMRRHRRLVFQGLWSRRDLRPRERLLLAYALARSSVGELVAARTMGRARA